jgi:hypothetical protein
MRLHALAECDQRRTGAMGSAVRAGKQRVGSVPSSRCRCVVGLKVGIGRVKTENAVGHTGTLLSDIALACVSV